MKYIVTLLLIYSLDSYSQKLLLPNEEIIFSFKTYKGKTVLLAKDKANKYMVYRFGTEENAELEFPSRNPESWKKFRYNFYFRGGGKQNLGLDIDNLKFVNNGYEYVLYTSYSAGDADENAEESYSIGINVRDEDGEETRILGDPKTQTGNLNGFRTNKLIKIDESMQLEE